MDHLPAATVNRFCASSTQTMRMAFHAIKAGEGDTFLVGGVECVSQYSSFSGAGGSDTDTQNPLFADAAARAAEMARTNAVWTDPRDDGLLPDVYLAMGQTAENVATSRGVSRQRQDEWGVTSQNRAEKAIADGFFEREILPVTLADGTVVARRRRPARRGHPRGRAGPQPGVPRERHDHRRQLLPAQRRRLRGGRHERRPGARAGPHARWPASCRPGCPGCRPRSWASDRSRRRGRRWPGPGMTIGDMDLYEINEAFAAQVLPSADDLGMDLGQAQRARRRDRAGPPVRVDRHPDHDHPAQRAARRATASSASRRCASAVARAWRSSSSGSADPATDVGRAVAQDGRRSHVARMAGISRGGAAR